MLKVRFLLNLFQVNFYISTGNVLMNE